MANKRAYWRPPIGARVLFAILVGVALAVVLAGRGRDAVTAAPGDSEAARGRRQHAPSGSCQLPLPWGLGGVIMIRKLEENQQALAKACEHFGVLRPAR
jgi:hypothetical protein